MGWLTQCKNLEHHLNNVCCVNHFFLLAQTSKHARLMLCIITLTTHWCVNMAHLFLLVTSKLFYTVHNKIIISINPVAIKVKGSHVFKTAPKLQKHEDEKCQFAIKLWQKKGRTGGNTECQHDARINNSKVNTSILDKILKKFPCSCLNLRYAFQPSIKTTFSLPPLPQENSQLELDCFCSTETNIFQGGVRGQ